MQNPSFLGRGWSLPPQFDSRTARTKVVETGLRANVVYPFYLYEDTLLVEAPTVVL